MSITRSPAVPALLERAGLMKRARQAHVLDLVVVGGGATGLGVALDAALRGLKVALVERDDFAKGTSSRATKLVHGGVRYLAQGNISLVREALRERSALLANAPHIAQPLAFVVPGYGWADLPFYGAGLTLYDALAGRRGLHATTWLNRQATVAALPTVRQQGLRGGICYWDGQFDDARLAVLLARTASAQGALVLNHCAATGLIHEGGSVQGVQVQDGETQERFELRARCVVNATGVWVDELRAADAQAGGAPSTPMVSPSQGVHLVVDKSFLPGQHALMVPKTADGRVLFMVPWLGKVLLGTTDTPVQRLDAEPKPLHDEVEFILNESARYLTRAPKREDVRSVWVGLRPLVKLLGEAAGATKTISREHSIVVSPSNLVTVTGGKWTTYRAMAEDVLAQCMSQGLLPHRPAGVTEDFHLLGAAAGLPLSTAPGVHTYGSEAAAMQSLPGADRWLWRLGEGPQPAGGLSEAMVRFALRYEMARTLEDVLARRSRVLFLDASAAAALVEPVAALIEEELGRTVSPQEKAQFLALAQAYATLP